METPNVISIIKDKITNKPKKRDLKYPDNHISDIHLEEFKENAVETKLVGNNIADLPVIHIKEE